MLARSIAHSRTKAQHLLKDCRQAIQLIIRSDSKRCRDLCKQACMSRRRPQKTCMPRYPFQWRLQGAAHASETQSLLHDTRMSSRKEKQGNASTFYSFCLLSAGFHIPRWKLKLEVNNLVTCTTNAEAPHCPEPTLSAPEASSLRAQCSCLRPHCAKKISKSTATKRAARGTTCSHTDRAGSGGSQLWWELQQARQEHL